MDIQVDIHEHVFYALIPCRISHISIVVVIEAKFKKESINEQLIPVI